MLTTNPDALYNKRPNVVFGPISNTPASPIILPDVVPPIITSVTPAIAAPKWKHISQVRNEGLAYMEARQKGLIKSLQTPWNSFNEAGIDGIEWGNVVVIGGRPASGKTLMTSLITTQAFPLNPTQNFGVLNFQFEMSTQTTAVREFSNVLKMSYKQLLNADKARPLTMSDILNAKHYAGLNSQQPIYQVEDAMTVSQIESEVDAFYKFIQKPFVVTIDHSILVEKGKGEKDQFDTLHELGRALTRMKKRYPVIFIILTQMNRSIEGLDRKVNGTMGNYPFTSDIYGADALLQHCDMMAAINRPSLYNLAYYGPEQYVVHPNLIALHWLKVRNGELGISFFNADFANMGLIENSAPIKAAGGQSNPNALSTTNYSRNKP
jgi:replicative DNA helicase